MGSSNIDEALSLDQAGRAPLHRRRGRFRRQARLDNAWAIHAVKAVGNYGEIFERNLGAGSKLAIPRGLNQFGRPAESSTRRRCGEEGSRSLFCVSRPPPPLRPPC